MTNIVHLTVPSQRLSDEMRHAALATSFAQHRRFGDDVFWLKENAELLNILECSGAEIDGNALESYADFYNNVEKRIQFFPQYYRFLLSICLDLEDMGLSGQKGERLCQWVSSKGFAQAELSDLQRLEARRLLMRRGYDPLQQDVGLENRMRAFMSRSATFSMPNKKAAYELTHTVFYLSEYGRKDPCLDGDARKSLEFVGLLAFLEQNADLLAEVCVSLKYAGFDVPDVWEQWLVKHTHRFDVQSGGQGIAQDDYHEFLVCNWMMMATGHRAFTKPLSAERMTFFRPEGGAGPLRELSECMYQMDEQRSNDWGAMRPVVLDQLSENAQSIVADAENSCGAFDAFFEGFARAETTMGIM